VQVDYNLGAALVHADKTGIGERHVGEHWVHSVREPLVGSSLGMLSITTFTITL
jgi:hypothetical protein